MYAHSSCPNFYVKPCSCSCAYSHRYIQFWRSVIHIALTKLVFSQCTRLSCVIMHVHTVYTCTKRAHAIIENTWRPLSAAQKVIERSEAGRWGEAPASARSMLNALPCFLSQWQWAHLSPSTCGRAEGRTVGAEPIKRRRPVPPLTLSTCTLHSVM